MIRATAAALYGFALALAAQPAQAGLTLCNRTSYRVDAAFGLEKQPKVATRGWFKLDPGECKEVVDGTLDADMVYVHSRTPPVYGTPPEAETGQAELCVRAGDFDIPDGRDCPLSQQVHFAAARPSDSKNGPVVYLAEQAAYDDAQARRAGIQRLLTIAGYDAYPIDGVKGTKTEKAIAQFLSDHKLSADEAFKPGFFDTLLAAARNPQGKGFSWCNDTRYTVMASLGVVEMGAIVTRGWYRIAAGKCLRPVLRGHPHRLYSYAEAVDDSGRMVMREGKPLAWGGSLPLCTRGGRFALSNHKDCSTRSLKSAGFAVIHVGAKPSTTVRFKEP
ncbi:MAG: DUF1036 domain-containing protein [Pseudolabrys sp.]